jgi:hypothetical protein
MLIPKHHEQKLPNYDLKAGRQIFDKEHVREDGYKASIAKDTENPIDIRLRQMVMASLDGTIDLRGEFLHKNIVAIIGDIYHLRIVKGKIADMYLVGRELRIKNRKGEDIIVSFDKVMEYSSREI